MPSFEDLNADIGNGKADTGSAHLPPVVGSVLKNRYKLLERIGRGALSTVFQALDLRKVETRGADPVIALKILNPLFHADTQIVALLRSETGKLQRLAHPNIVRVMDCDREGPTVFITMEFLEGESLERRLQRAGGAPLVPEDAERIIESIVSALAVAHRNGSIHGDLDPGNVIVTNTAEVKVIDFGIGRLLRRETGNATSPYASPESCEGREPDPRDDIYSLACIAHEILAGEHPYGRTDALQARDSGFRLERHERLSRRQYRAIAHGLDFDRNARTQTATQFLEELRADSVGRVLRWGAHGCLVLAVLAISFFAWLRHTQADRRVRLGENSGGPSAAIAPGAVFRDCPTCPLLKAVPAGSFVQGSLDNAPAAAAAEKPRHSVAIPAKFAIGAYEITVAEYKELAQGTQRAVQACEVYDGAWQVRSDRNWLNPGFEQTVSHPVVCVSWNDAQDYVSWLSSRTHYHYRLPRTARSSRGRSLHRRASMPMSRIRPLCSSFRAGAPSPVRTAMSLPLRSGALPRIPLACLTS